MVPLWKQQDLRLLHRNIWTIRWSIDSLRSCRPGLPRNQTSLQESIFLLLTIVTFLRAITICSGFTPDCGYDNSTIILIGDVYCPNSKCSGKLCLHKQTFQSLGSRQTRLSMSATMRVCVPGAQYSFWRSNEFFFLSFGPSILHLWKESKMNSRFYGRFVLSWQVLFQQREMRISWWLCNNSEINYGCGKLGAWLFVQKVTLMLQEHVKTTITDKIRFVFDKKKNLVPSKQMLFNFPFQSTKYGKNELCVDNKVQQTIGDVYCPTCRIENCVCISTNEMVNFHDYKKCRACCHVLNTPLKDHKQTIMLYVGDGTHCFAKKDELRLLKRKTNSIFEETSPPVTTKHNQTWTKESGSHSIYGWFVSTPHWLTQLISFLKSFYSLSIPCQPVEFNQLTVNLKKIMIFSVSNDGIQWTLDFDPDSVTISVSDLVQNITIGSKKYL